MDKLSNRVSELARIVWLFGKFALGNAVLTQSRGLAYPNPYRVSDVLIAENVPKGGKGGQVLIAGPMASDVLG